MLRKYFNLYKTCIANSLSYEAEYRYDTLIKLFTNILWIGMMFITIEVIFSQTQSIGGWNKGEVYLMTVFWIIADEIFSMLFSKNLFGLSDLITDGDLDFYLTKPVAPLFLVSTRFLNIGGLYRLLIEGGILGWLLWHFHFPITLPTTLAAALLLLLSVVIDYSRVLIGNTFSFWFLRFDNINDVIGALSSVGRYPLSIWPRTFKIIFLTVLPVAFSGFLPAAAFVGRAAWYLLAYAVVFTIIFFYIAARFWNFALRHYSSASS